MTEKGGRSLKQSLKIHLNGQSAKEKDFKDRKLKHSQSLYKGRNIKISALNVYQEARKSA